MNVDLSSTLDQPLKKANMTRRNWQLDVLLLLVFMLVSAPMTTGIPLHEWLGLLIFAPLFYHLVWHWKWVVGVFTRSSRKLPGHTIFAKWFNLALFFMMLLAGVSGLMISEALLPMLGWMVGPDNFWLTVHKASATLMMLLIGLHLTLHWRWIAQRLKRPPTGGMTQ
ncbi:DUF4405 domain-containing protein [Deinococcus yavapaiensis]|uniref:Uncharacterized protein DUF4405 n=1 Tax=Deinococcus yavapaiensis KR-236 TaxID=694435 RepID=A0A318S070_9DEIO|nr:DUF4405 domain-containing protein [Deinococcus yavapaiensis]PYE48348.1 uncharacterized protein DUF4405 [Deinococcus yavapaiensis KR-236]